MQVPGQQEPYNENMKRQAGKSLEFMASQSIELASSRSVKAIQKCHLENLKEEKACNSLEHIDTEDNFLNRISIM